MTEWQSIRTAPKNGQYLLLLEKGDPFPTVGHWVYYDPEDAEEIGETGYWSASEDLIASVVDELRPIWWMHCPPLPTP